MRTLLSPFSALDSRILTSGWEKSVVGDHGIAEAVSVLCLRNPKRLTEAHVQRQSESLRNVRMGKSRRVRNDRVSRKGAMRRLIRLMYRSVKALEHLGGHLAFGGDVAVLERFPAWKQTRIWCCER